VIDLRLRGRRAEAFPAFSIIVLILSTDCATTMETSSAGVYRPGKGPGTRARDEFALHPGCPAFLPCRPALPSHTCSPLWRPVTPYYGKGFLTQLILPALQNLDAIMVVAPDCPGERLDRPGERAGRSGASPGDTEGLPDRPAAPSHYRAIAWAPRGPGIMSSAPRLFSAAIAVSGMPPQGDRAQRPPAPPSWPFTAGMMNSSRSTPSASSSGPANPRAFPSNSEWLPVSATIILTSSSPHSGKGGVGGESVGRGDGRQAEGLTILERV